MQKIKIRLPATLTNFGPSHNSLGLALSLYTQVEITPRDDSELVVETGGEGVGQYALAVQHPVILAMSRVFQMLERAPTGITVRVDNAIPLHSGLGAEAALMTAGVIGANNLMGNPLKREALLNLAASVTKRPANAVTAMVGGLTTSLMADDQLIYRSLPLTPFKLILALPRPDDYTRPELPDRIPAKAAIANLQQLPLILEALNAGDLALLAKMLPDHIGDETTHKQISGFAHVAEVAKRAGAIGLTTSGGGPAILIFAERHHERIASAVTEAFQQMGTAALVRVLLVDTQGIVISIVQGRARK